MGFQRNTIPKDEHKERSLKIIENGVKTRQDAEELFLLYNDILLPRETGIGCGGCRKRVYERLKAYYQTN